MKLGKITYATLTLILILIGVSVNVANAQYYRRNSYNFSDGLSVSLMFGPTIFAGDLGVTLIDPEESQHQKEKGYVSISGGLAFEKEIKEYLSLGLQGTYGILQGGRENVGDSYPYTKFKSTIYEISLPVHVDITTLAGGYYKFRKVSFYAIVAPTLLLSSGTNLQNLDPATGKVLLGGDDVLTKMGKYASEHAGGASHIDQAFMLKAGGGAKIRIDDKWSVKVEYTGNFGIGSDPGDGWEWKVDHLDHTYFRTKNGQLVPTNGDFYYIGQVGISYQIGSSSFRSKPKYNRKSYAHRYKKSRYKGRSRKRR